MFPSFLSGEIMRPQLITYIYDSIDGQLQDIDCNFAIGCTACLHDEKDDMIWYVIIIIITFPWCFNPELKLEFLLIYIIWGQILDVIIR